MYIYIDSDMDYIKKKNKSKYITKGPTHNETCQRNTPTLLKNSQICTSNWKTSKVFTKSQQNLKKC